MSYLTEVNDFEATKTMRQMYRHHRNGYSNDRGKSMRHMVSIPKHVWDRRPDIRAYFDPEMDSHESRKALYAFIKKFPQFVVVDKV